MAAILRDSADVVVVDVRTRPRAIPLAMIIMRKSIHEFPLLSYIDMVLRLATLLWVAGAPLPHDLNINYSEYAAVTLIMASIRYHLRFQSWRRVVPTASLFASYLDCRLSELAWKGPPKIGRIQLILNKFTLMFR